jgi:hypothetical protein
MKIARYTNAFVQNTPILLGSPPSAYGTLLSEYDVTEYWDLRTSTAGSNPARAYIVALKQRLTLYNDTADGFAGLLAPDAYSSYPILAVQAVSPLPTAGNMTFYLEDYSPKTLNAAVSTTQNQGTDAQTSSSLQHTAGSSTSETNSFEVSDSVGFFGMDPTGSVSAGYTNSTTNTTERSDTRSRGRERGVQSSAGASMSIKDWGSYAFLDANKQNPSWAWGQEYPWNVISFRGTADQGKTISLPPYVQKQLCDGTFLYPPSQISQFGLDFVVHAKWIFYVDGQAGPDDEQVSFDHTLTYWEGSHSSVGDPGKLTVVAVMEPMALAAKLETVTLNLPVLSLEPITSTGIGNGAVVGFVQTEFIAPPSANKFRLKSSANNLYISQGTGFDAPADDDSVLTAENISSSTPASLLVQFKITDPDIELTLHLKHWKTTPAGCALTIDVNGQSIMRHIDSMNASGGTDNITSITLRTRDYTSPEYYDYLVMGLNVISVSIAPSVSGSTCGYALRALAIQ